MPILVSGGGSQFNRSAGVVLNSGLQRDTSVSPTCNRRLMPPAPAPGNTTAYLWYRLYVTGVLFGAGTSLAEMDLALTSSGADTTAGQTFTADSSFDGSTLPANGFDDNAGTFWASAFVSLPAWIKVGYISPTVINELAITARNDASGPDQTARDFLFQGSNDDLAWADLITRTGEVWAAGERKTFQATAFIAVTGAAGLTFAPSGTLAGKGAVAGSSTLAFAPSGTVSGKGTIAGASSLTFSPAATATGKGALVAASTLVFTPAGTMTGKGAVVGASTLAFSPSGTVAGKGSITGASTLTLSPSGALAGKGALIGSSSLVLSASGALVGQGALSGASSLIFTPTATVGGAGAISGASSISFTLAGLLSSDAVIIPHWPPFLTLTPDPVPVAV